MKRFVAIDGNSLLFRAFFAMREMVTKDGIYTQGVFAFINMLNKILSDYKPDYIAVAFDMKAKTFRHEAYPEYKAGRLKTPMELLSQVPLMQDVLRAMNIAVLQKEGFEADDIIGTLASHAEKSGLETYIISGDKDELQLVDENTYVVINRKGMTEFDIYDVEAMNERYGLSPKLFVDLKGLMGDKSDNIPGIPGVGEKKGLALLKDYGSVEGVIEHADEIKGKLGENVRANLESAKMSKWLATIKCDVELDVTPEDLEYTEPNYEQLIELYKKLEFHRFLKNLEEQHESEAEASVKIDLLEDVSEVSIEEFLEKMEAGQDVAIELQSDANHQGFSNISGLILYNPSNGMITNTIVTPLDCSVRLSEVLSKNPQLIGSDLKSVAYTFLQYGLENFNLKHDVEVAEYLLDPNKSKYNLENMYLRYTNDTLDASDGCKRMVAMSVVAEKQQESLRYEGMFELFEKCEMPLVTVLASMEIQGMKVDQSVLREVGKELEERIETLEQIIYAAADCTFNINSPKQLGEVLFEKMELPYPKKTKGKNKFSTAADVLEKLEDEYEIVRDILQYRKATKLKSTYIDGLLGLIGDDGRIHPHFNQTVAATGRLSCTEPNLQNIPIRDEYGRNIRKAFVVSKPENIFVGADYSQIELRLMAALSEDSVMLEAFRTGVDIHALTASRVFEMSLEEVTPLDRSRAKAVNFGVIYGMSGFGLSENLGITRKDAQRYIDDYFTKHVAVKEYLDRQIEDGKANGQVTTMFGRIRPIPEFKSRRYMDIQLANRLAMNSPIQGSAADIIKIAMNKVHAELTERKMKSKLVLQIHDELIVEATPNELEDVKELLQRNMENAVEISVPLDCDMHCGSTWYDLK
jgi:DNA polymerase I